MDDNSARRHSERNHDHTLQFRGSFKSSLVTVLKILKACDHDWADLLWGKPKPLRAPGSR
jgi:hypothetical protein